ncbi:MAG: hypothetical protein WCV80_02475 [Candidatus Paceibacterota bacterium]
MADFQFPGQQWSNQNPVIGTGEGEVPLAKIPTEPTMRTMASDVASIKETGGGEPRPYIPKEIPPSFPDMSQPVTPKKDFVVPPVIPAFVPPQEMGAVSIPTPQGTSGESGKGKSKSGIFIGIAVFVTLVGLAAIVYFFVIPKFTTTPVETPTATPVIPPIEVPEIIETATTTEQEPIIPPVPPTSESSQLPTVDTHSSLFKNSADLTSEVTLTEVTMDSVKKSLEASVVEVPVLREIVFKNSTGKVYALSALLPLFSSSTFTTSTNALFAPDATFFTYADSKGVWPGFVLRLATGADSTVAKTDIKKLEVGNEFASFFLTDPGTGQAWKDGKVGTTTARYAPFSKTGIAFSYVWFENNLIVSTSYAGAQAASKKLGF